MYNIKGNSRGASRPTWKEKAKNLLKSKHFHYPTTLKAFFRVFLFSLVIIISQAVYFLTPASGDTVDMTFPAGWTSFSPGFTSSSLLSTMLSNNLYVYEYGDGEFSSINIPSTMVRGNPYWVYAETETTIQVTDATAPVLTSKDWTLLTGWNFIGNPYGCGIPSTTITLDGVKYADATAETRGIYSFSGDAYAESGAMQGNMAYWIYVGADSLLSAPKPNCGLSVTASVTPTTGTTADSFTLSCAVSGGSASVLEGRCDSVDDWAAITSGIVKNCGYVASGSFVPGCRANESVSDDVDSAISVTAVPVCGNSFVEDGENCDDGNKTTETCAYGETSCSVCGATCALVAGATSYCGDFEEDAGNGEQCDDGGTEDGDGCSSTCQDEVLTATPYATPASGTISDSYTITCVITGATATVLEGRCDSIDSWSAIVSGDSIDCSYSATGTFYPGCMADSLASGTTALMITDSPVCGDSAVQATEGCDDGNESTEECAYGQTSCSVCDLTCHLIAGATSYCGDSATDAVNLEQCDDGNSVTETCAYGEMSCTVCDATCQSVAGAISYCGDGATDTVNFEQCDDGNSDTESCAYGETSCTVCNSACQSAAGDTSYCGDSAVDAGNGEQCDDGGTTGGDGCSATCQDEPRTVTASVAPTTGSILDTYTLTCAVNRSGETTLEARCDSGDGWTDITGGATYDCTYALAGSYLPGCRVDSNNTDDVDSSITVSMALAATASIFMGNTADTYVITCAVSGGTATTLEARCDDGESWTSIASGNTMDCNYPGPGQFLPGCRLDGAITDDADQQITVFEALPYAVVGTQITKCYDDAAETTCPSAGQAFFGQDGNIPGRPSSYVDNGDGTITDLNTGLMWQQARGSKMTWDAAMAGASSVTTGGYTDWRPPTIKEIYSLIDFTGQDVSTLTDYNTTGIQPFIDDSVFEHVYGRESDGDRVIDCQDWSSTEYVSTTMNGDATVFGVNFCDGRIKGYPKIMLIPPSGAEDNVMYIRYVRGNPNYGQNSFTDNGDGTISDGATGLMWTRDDSGAGMNWESALAWVETKNGANYLGRNDWRLPSIKELNSIVDYSRSPDTTSSAAIDPIFNATSFTDEADVTDYPFYWSGTTHVNTLSSDFAAYMTFGEALGYMEDPPPGSNVYTVLDVHGAGAQRSDPKAGSVASYPHGHGPQGDVVRIDNYVRLVRNLP